ncbi:MAG: histidine phosphatase family protein, partial [Pseudomonadota bacterium]
KKEPALIETDWGEWEGQRLVDIRAADPEGLAEREAAGLDFFPPGGESARDVQERLMPFLAERAHDEKGTIAIAHRGTLRALYALCVGWDMTGPPPDKMRPACAHAFSLEIDGAVHIHTLNLPLDTS